MVVQVFINYGKMSVEEKIIIPVSGSLLYDPSLQDNKFKEKICLAQSHVNSWRKGQVAYLLLFTLTSPL